VDEPRPLVFGEDWADPFIGIAPVVETALDAFVGRCQLCGRSPRCQREGSVLVNVLTVEGTLYGDTFCTNCFEQHEWEIEADGPAFFLPLID
jgi:hypothetical protein